MSDIDTTQAALDRTSAKIDRMSAIAMRDRDCCPSCRFGREFCDACDKCDRQAAWLVVLLCKRGGDEDIDRAWRIALDVGPLQK